MIIITEVDNGFVVSDDVSETSRVAHTTQHAAEIVFTYLKDFSEPCRTAEAPMDEEKREEKLSPEKDKDPRATRASDKYTRSKALRMALDSSSPDTAPRIIAQRAEAFERYLVGTE